MVLSDGLPEQRSGEKKGDGQDVSIPSAGAASMMPMMFPYMPWNPFMQFTAEQLMAFTQMYGMFGFPYMTNMMTAQTAVPNLDNTEASKVPNIKRESAEETPAIDPEGFKKPNSRSISPPLKKALLQRYNGMLGFGSFSFEFVVKV